MPEPEQVPLGQGVLVLGEHTITYHSGPDFKSIPINFACFKAATPAQTLTRTLTVAQALDLALQP